MILRNYYNILAGVILGNTKGPHPERDVYGRGSLLVGRSIDGYKLGWPNTSNTGTNMSLTRITYINVNTNGVFICFGTGTTPVTFEDQNLESRYENLKGANFTTGDPVFNEETGKFEVDFSCVVTNSGAEQVTLTEMGVGTKFYYSYSAANVAGLGANSNNNATMLYREILSTPITLEANESITYHHKFEVAIPEIS